MKEARKQEKKSKPVSIATPKTTIKEPEEIIANSPPLEKTPNRNQRRAKSIRRSTATGSSTNLNNFLEMLEKMKE